MSIYICLIENKKLGDNTNLTYIGTFNGYDGEIASRKCSSQLHLAFLFEFSRMYSNIIKYERSIGDEINEYEYDLDLNKNDKFEEDENAKSSQNNGLTKENREEHYLSCVSKSFCNAYKKIDRLIARGDSETFLLIIY
jgi:hypothetical protein